MEDTAILKVPAQDKYYQIVKNMFITILLEQDYPEEQAEAVADKFREILNTLSPEISPKLELSFNWQEKGLLSLIKINNKENLSDKISQIKDKCPFLSDYHWGLVEKNQSLEISIPDYN